MLSIANTIFQDKLVCGDRLPVSSFTWGDDQFGIFLPSIAFWLQLLLILVISGGFCFFVWATTFYFIIPNRNKHPVKACLVAFGLLAPLTALMPIVVLQQLDISNKVLRFIATGILPVLTFFHISEALNGYSPSGTEDSFREYLTYNLAILPIEYAKEDYGKKNDDKKQNSTNKREPLRATRDSIISVLAAFLMQVIMMGISMSLLIGYNFEPFETTADGNVTSFDIWHIFDLNLIKNNIVTTVFFQISLTTFIVALGLVVQLTLGIQTKGAMKNPVFTSTSIAEFWGERWNLIIHGALKRGVFKPVYRISSSKILGVLATFLASGLFHEYLVKATAMHSTQVIKPAFGKNTAFMMWNAMTLTVEFITWKIPIVKSLRSKLPAPVLTACVLFSALPVAHWFIHPYIKIGFFHDFEPALPMVLKL